jgi:hypothetical protein
VLFANLADKGEAGMLAGKLFALIAYLGMGCGAYLLLHRFMRFGGAAMKQAFFWIVVSMLLLTVTGHFGIQPILAKLKNEALPAEVMQSVFKDRFETWHGIASGVYLLESLLGVPLVLKNRG